MDHRALLLSLRDLLASAQTLVQPMLTLEGGSDALVTPPPSAQAALPPPQAALPPGPPRVDGPAVVPSASAEVGADDPRPAKPPRDRSAQKRALQSFWANLTPEDRAARIARMQGARKKKT